MAREGGSHLDERIQCKNSTKLRFLQAAWNAIEMEFGGWSSHTRLYGAFRHSSKTFKAGSYECTEESLRVGNDEGDEDRERSLAARSKTGRHGIWSAAARDSRSEEEAYSLQYGTDE